MIDGGNGSSSLGTTAAPHHTLASGFGHSVGHGVDHSYGHCDAHGHRVVFVEDLSVIIGESERRHDQHRLRRGGDAADRWNGRSEQTLRQLLAECSPTATRSRRLSPFTQTTSVVACSISSAPTPADPAAAPSPSTTGVRTASPYHRYLSCNRLARLMVPLRVQSSATPGNTRTTADSNNNTGS